MSVVILARHGRTAWHHPNRYTGSSDIPLDNTGRDQAEQLAAWAAGQDVAAVASSGLDRAVSTARAVAQKLGLSLIVDDRLRELDFGVAEGRTLEEITQSDPAVAKRFTDDPADGHFPGGEHPAAALGRFVAGLAAVTARTDGQTTLIVAHSTIIRLAVCAAVGIPLSQYRRRLPRLNPTALTELRLGPGGSPEALLAYNVPVSGRLRP